MKTPRILAFLLLSVLSFAQVNVAPLVPPIVLGPDFAGAKLYTYQAGTSTPLATYQDSAGTILNSNPVILDANGIGRVFVKAQSYKIVLKSALDVTILTLDNLTTLAVLGKPFLSDTLANRPTTCTATVTFFIQTDSPYTLFQCNSTGTGWNALIPAWIPTSIGTAGQQPTVNSTATAAPFQSPPYGIDVRSKGAACDGVTADDTAWHNAIVAAKTFNAPVILPYNCKLKLTTTSTDLNLGQGIRIIGGGGGGGGQAGGGYSSILCSQGVGVDCIQARSSGHIRFEHILLYVNSPTFNGWVINNTGDLGGDSDGLVLDDFQIGGNSAANWQGNGVNTCLANDIEFHDGLWEWLNQPVKGRGAGCQYSNVVKFTGYNLFLWNSAQFAILNPGQKWDITGTFEGEVDSGNNAGQRYPGAVGYDSTIVTLGPGQGDTVNVSIWTEGVGGPGAWVMASAANFNVTGSFLAGGTAPIVNLASVSSTSNHISVIFQSALLYRSYGVFEFTGTGTRVDGKQCVIEKVDSTHATCWLPGGDFAAVLNTGTVTPKLVGLLINTTGSSQPTVNVTGTSMSAANTGGIGIAAYDANNAGALGTLRMSGNVTYGSGGRTLVDPQAVLTGNELAELLNSTRSGLTLPAKWSQPGVVGFSYNPCNFDTVGNGTHCFTAQTYFFGTPLNLGAAGVYAADDNTVLIQDGVKAVLKGKTHNIGAVGSVTQFNFPTSAGKACGVISGGATGACIGANPSLWASTASNSDLAGQLVLVAGTKSYTFVGTYASAPTCVASDTAATPVDVQVTTSTTTLTLTVPGGANTDTFNYICVART